MGLLGLLQQLSYCVPAWPKAVLPRELAVLCCPCMVNCSSFAVQVVPTSSTGRKDVPVHSMFCRCPKLIRVALHINELTSVPEEVAAMASLQASTWHRNKLTELPPGIGNLKSLTELALFTNQLVSLPDEFCRMSKLTELWLYDNRLESLPDAFGSLSSLR